MKLLLTLYGLAFGQRLDCQKCYGLWYKNEFIDIDNWNSEACFQGKFQYLSTNDSDKIQIQKRPDFYRSTLVYKAFWNELQLKWVSINELQSWNCKRDFREHWLDSCFRGEVQHGKSQASRRQWSRWLLYRPSQEFLNTTKAVLVTTLLKYTAVHCCTVTQHKDILETQSFQPVNPVLWRTAQRFRQ